MWAGESENNHVQKIFLKVLSLVKGVQGRLCCSQTVVNFSSISDIRIFKFQVKVMTIKDEFYIKPICHMNVF